MKSACFKHLTYNIDHISMVFKDIHLNKNNCNSKVSSDTIVKVLEEDFLNDYISVGKPCIITNMSTDWNAIKLNKWSIDNLEKNYGHCLFSYNNDTRRKLNNDSINHAININLRNINEQQQLNAPQVMKLKDFLDEIKIWDNENDNNIINEIKFNDHCQQDISNIKHCECNQQQYAPNPPYIFDPTFDYNESSSLLLDYKIPDIFNGGKNNILSLIPRDLRPNEKWLLLGPKNSGNTSNKRKIMD